MKKAFKTILTYAVVLFFGWVAYGLLRPPDVEGRRFPSELRPILPHGFTIVYEEIDWHFPNTKYVNWFCTYYAKIHSSSGNWRAFSESNRMSFGSFSVINTEMRTAKIPWLAIPAKLEDQEAECEFCGDGPDYNLPSTGHEVSHNFQVHKGAGYYQRSGSAPP